jgi:hypothetical protein
MQQEMDIMALAKLLLHHVPQQFGSPRNVVWPTKPE